jgi:hypothetical protein
MDALSLHRRQTIALSERAQRRLRRFAQEASLTESEAITFVFEHFDSLMHEDSFMQRLKQFQARSTAQKGDA